ncbi:unnamed protein product [[Candida] boidinii]|uniref:Unnamed protein product n=1 Tax=Candida boidinii TaxID=5477 RepID=A0A9W6WF57_CANBO|nr:hypothetical protein BVG19_g2929 [[Candida] boidinii]OWB52010.1 hypothetical protein B5S27_g3581 [[Candida] boidinii]OWB66479.1 hypothetical protein B5S30_g1820 [[Candida] boidinii]GME67722.1 unnamed protein product [[Candida] boidinii]GMG01207.1 unnamed protein product [[Candida] boidinii]
MSENYAYSNGHTHTSVYNYNEYENSSVTTEFEFQKLPLELQLKVITYLDYVDLDNMSKVNDYYRSLIRKNYFNYLLNIRNSNVKYRLENWIKNLKPDLRDVLVQRAVSYKNLYLLFYSHSGLVNRSINYELNSLLHQFRISQYINKMIKRTKLNKFFQDRPSKCELISRNILKDDNYKSNRSKFLKCFSSNANSINCVNSNLSNWLIVNRIIELEKENISFFLSNFIRLTRLHTNLESRFNRSNHIKFVETNKDYKEFVKTVNFFENLILNNSNSLCNDLILNEKPLKPVKKVLKAEVCGNNITFVRT